MRNLLRLVFWVTVLSAGACGSLPTASDAADRERLADPVVLQNRSPLPTLDREYLHESREAARGATGVTLSGCPCR
ncbi:MAG: hypothetical protein NVSMB10_16300 [Steroidobacteraceae bacterium]